MATNSSVAALSYWSEVNGAATGGRQCGVTTPWTSISESLCLSLPVSHAGPWLAAESE